jgi:hypothetical protein
MLRCALLRGLGIGSFEMKHHLRPANNTPRRIIQRALKISLVITAEKIDVVC